jgi:5S rRNA maturation endonuclease (ribonuclease M5)
LSALSESKSYQYVELKGWNYRATEDHLILESCPICERDGWKFYMRFSPAEKDGVWDCKVCGESGNMYQLREFLGDRLSNVTSMSDVAASGRQASPLPDAEAAHRRLMKEAEEAESDVTLDYLVSERGYSMAVIEKYKLGIVQDFGKKWLVIPYFHKNNLVYAKFRTLPPEKKEFRGVSGREAPLFNEDALAEGVEELMFVEGEGDCLSCLSNGIENVVGIPGANMKKLAWMKKLDDVDPKKIYLLYDNDKVGQDAAKEMAKRIGVQKCYNIVLPKAVGATEIKDINEFFVAGGTLADFETLKAQAKPFSIEGVQGLSEIVTELKEDLLGGGSLEPTWATQYPSVNAHIGGFEEGDLVGIMGEAKCGKTSWALNILDSLVERYKLPAMFYCQEMNPKRVIRKWIAYVTDTNDENIVVDTVDTALNIACEREADYLFAYTPRAKAADVFETIRQTVRRYGVKFVCFDNLQVLCRAIQNNSQETAAVCQGFKDLAMELGIVIFLIIQPNRVGEGEVISSRNAMGSSAIEKIVDTMLCTHRNREGKVKQEDLEALGFIEVNENFTPPFYVRADLTRYASGGTTTLWLDGAKSKVTEFSEANKQRAAALIPLNDVVNGMREAA